MGKAQEERIRTRTMRRILDAATEVFARKGFDGTRITEIAEATGLPKANVYYYFGSKDDIYRSVIARLIQSWDEALEEIALEKDPAEALTRYVTAKLRFSREYPTESRLFASEILRGAEFLTDQEREHIREVTNQRVAVIEAWIAAGKIAQVDARHLLIMLWAATQFYADFDPVVRDALGNRKLKVADFDAAARCITDTILVGLIPREINRT